MFILFRCLKKVFFFTKKKRKGFFFCIGKFISFKSFFFFNFQKDLELEKNHSELKLLLKISTSD